MRQDTFTQIRGDLGELLHQETRLAVVWMASPQHEGRFFLPSMNLKGCLHRELRCDTAYALQRRVMDVLTLGQEKLFPHGVGHFSTPHSGRHFLPSAAAALNVEKSDCDMLGGCKTWSRRLSRTEPTAIRSLKQMRWTSSLSFSNGKVQAKNSRQSISRSCRFSLSSRRERSRGWTWEKCNNVRKKRRRKNEKRRRRQKLGGSSKRGTSTGHPSWATIHVKHAKLSGNPSSKDSTSPRARRKTSRRYTCWDNAV